jgi:hypothetical protein
MKIAAIMQPTYLPWMGYFDMIDRSDCFVFLDSVQFEKRSWQQRNRIQGPDGELWLTVPVQTKGRYSQMIVEARIDPTMNFGEKHIKTITHLYCKSPFFKNYIDGLSAIILKPYELISDLNIDLIRWFTMQLGIEKEMLRSSSIRHEGKKSRLLVNICESVGADTYLSAAGSRTYIEEENQFAPNGINVTYHSYHHPEYRQNSKVFMPYLSAVDLLFNEGPACLSIIRKGRED